MISIIFPLLIGFVFDILAGIKFGFYFVPALIMSVVFYFLPFIFVWLNIAIAYLAAFVAMIIWSYFLAGMNFSSSRFISHIALYLLIIGVTLYLINVLQKK
ncbi:hypothetical protein A2W54_03840 [Candidatus Giovannonibacteria bacterium RIFCSPHIGHO2_02_43_13]|uniref:Rod shape-determining protein MreD n=1 Tax=Candidatus Giovannonibacteria bacterium RIFCSPHIGHO2_02_43_13 TaxID=1798330 RepID=A0A1F5WRJ7_9BACT|nr:MAG: hypothetical protein UW28_C0013G0026 [Parcubacteria group bacterium GW2011_GWA2_44_13]OGF74652.1 MAG: hypothetical protein A3E06_02950 [Candidatus Giovannonibacteria bacterium RIFCSPHIGHO2_12_FULL_44_42]OGF78207.1 MAG: hypothetical protein A2W54_03840 [Candidatus Giovannonibacteria bacterium RIFCSPHIGHO2_02_43_13]OGF90073.1 MAG: hypothetical protein A3I94_03055 [Candidatus Giovannonibacteria bacterium RIFCSPLOWO2_02_FULL_43_54]OGF96614.1 MAG: hypothetical protein A3H08_01595 [Candidatus